MILVGTRQLSGQHIGFTILLLIASLLAAITAPWRAHGQGGGNQVTTVSAASFAPALAPDSIAAAFGLRLATRAEVATSQPLPTSLAGTTVRVNGELASLFFVSPGQINFLIPAGTPAGAANVVVTSGEGVVSTGSAQIAPVAPALFTADASGRGPLASLLLRIKANGQQIFEPLARREGDSFVTVPIDFGEESDQLFLALFLTGVRQAPASSVRVSIGGVEYAPLGLAPVSGFVGLDQINVPLPRNFSGRGRITLLVRAAGAGASNAGEFEIGSGTSLPANAPLQIAAPNQPVLAGEEVEIGGSGFAANPRENNARIVGDDGVTAKADVLAVSGNSMRVRVPFGAGTGKLNVSRGSVEASADIRVRTSVSGFIERAVQQDGRIVRVPVPGARVRVVGNPATERTTDAEGSFVMPDLPAANRTDFEILPPTAGALNFPTKKFSLRVRANRDNQLPRGDEQTLVSGAAFPLLADADPGVAANPEQGLTLTFLEPGRTPANLPAGHFSSRIAQIAPFGQTISPGARLSFTNTDAIPVGATARLFKFDQTTGSPTLGQFVDIGAATVTSDGQRVETAPNAITEGSYYFVSIPRPTAAINGRVVESNGTPAPRAIVQARGQSTFTDGFGGFVLRDAPVLKPDGDRVRVEVSYQRPDGRVARKDGAEVELIAGGLATIKPEIALDPAPANFPPVLLAPSSLTLVEGDSRLFDFIAYDPDNAQPPQITLAGTAAVFAALSQQSGGNFRLTLSPNAPGGFTLNLTATDAAGARNTQSIAITVNARNANAPIAQSQSVTTPEDTPRAITLTGSDPGGRALSYTVVNRPVRGSLSGVAPNLTYTPASNFNGADSFTFKVSNGSAESQPATVFIAASPVNDAPALVVPGPQEVTAGETLRAVVSAIDVDSEPGLKFTVTGLPPGATLIETGGTTRLLDWTPTFLQEGAYEIGIRVEDNGTPALSDAKTLRVSAKAKWAQTSGPPGGRILSLLDAGGAMYAGTLGGGVYRTTDNGRNWTPVNNGLTGNALSVYSLLAVGNSVFAGTSRGGVYRTTDNGQNWTPVNLGLPVGLDFSALLAAGNSIFVGTSSGVYRTTNNGQNWTPVNNGLTGNALFVDALLAVDNSIFAGTSFGVYRTTDNGQNWTRASNGLDGGALGVVALLAAGNSVFAGTGGGVYRTTDNGQNWTPVNNGLTGDALGISALSAAGDSIFAGTFSDGIYRTTDNGQNWTPVNSELSGAALSVRSLLAVGASVFAGTFGGGVYRTTDDGQNWRKSDSGMAASVIPAFAGVGDQLYASASQSVYRTSDNGIIWNQADLGLSETVFVGALLAAGNSIFAGTVGDGVYRTTDNGRNWTRVNNGLPGAALFVNTLLAAGDSVFAGTEGGVYRTANNGRNWTPVNNGLTGAARNVSALLSVDNSIFAGTSRGVYRTTDNGQNWTPVNNGLSGAALDVSALLAAGNSVFAGTFGGGVYRTTDNGQNWTPVNNGLTGAALSVNALLAVDNSIFAGASRGVYRTTDDGQNWAPVNNGLPGATLSVNTLSAAGNSVFVCLFRGGVYRTTDNGQNWAPLNNGLTGVALNVTDLLALSNSIFAGTEGGVYRTTDNGQNWRPANNGLTGAALEVSALLAASDSVFAGTVGGGVYRTTDNGQNWAPVNNGLRTDGLSVSALLAVGANIFAGTSGAFGGAGAGGVYRTTDNGQNWTPVNNGLTGVALDIRALSAAGNSVFAGTLRGVYRTTDNGQNWTPVNNGLTGAALDISALLAVGNSIFAGTSRDGVYRTTDNGQNWTPVNNGLTGAALSVRSLLSASDSIFAGTFGGGVYRTTDNGQNWTPFGAGLVNAAAFSMIVHEGKIFVGTYGSGVSVLSDSGQSWTENNVNLPARSINSVLVTGPDLFVGTLGSGVFRSSNQGQSWMPASAGLPPNANIQSIGASGATLWAAAFGDGVYASDNQGASWREVNNGLANKFVNELFVFGATLYAGTDGGVFRSTNGGSSWAPLNAGLTNLRVTALGASGGAVFAGTDGGGVFRLEGDRWVSSGLATLSVQALGAQGATLYAGTIGGGIFISRDGGQNWVAVNNQLPSNLNVFAFAAPGRKVYAGSIYGVFVTEDEGRNWKQVNAGLLNVFVTGLAVSGDQLFASTASGGVFSSQIP